jgi:uncharacterized protein (TIGR03382 family)
MNVTHVLGALCGAAVLVCSATASPWAMQVVSYSAGTGVDPAYTNPSAALGEPTRFTGVGVYPGAVTPFNPPWMPDDIVSIGPGGQLTVQFARQVVNDPLNPFGIDFIIFGNAGYVDVEFPNGIAGPMFGVGGGLVEVSANGSDWTVVPGVAADSAFPTLGYADLSDPYSTSPGFLLTDFTRPVDPSFLAAGKSFAQIVAAYAGSGGGTGVDIGAAGLQSISFVRISNPAGAMANVDIDALAIVTPIPGPGSLAALGLAGAALIHRRRRGGA